MSDDSLCARLDQFQISAGHDGSDALNALDNKTFVCSLPSSVRVVCCANETKQ